MTDGSQALRPPAYAILERSGGTARLLLYGDWIALSLGALVDRLAADSEGRPIDSVDVSELGRIDSAGALALLAAIPDSAFWRDVGRDDVHRLAQLVEPTADPTPNRPRGAPDFLVKVGMAVEETGGEAFRNLEFFGRLIFSLGRALAQPRRLRLTPLFAMMEAVGISAIPIVMTMTFFIGAVIALVGANLLTTLGVAVFSVQLVGVAVLREFGVVIASILLAGRSASAFAAALGSMRMNQEVDAMQVLGVDRFDALVVPRVIAALLMLPLMTFCADIGGIVGGQLVSWATMDISPVFFYNRLVDTVSVSHFWVGMSKTPLLALIVSSTGCRHGLNVGGSTESLGRQVTAAVVQSIFLIILVDAIFAVSFMVLHL
jgi:phospholipid/cholesterol/gamma-HCH transport system permease protein